MRSWCQPGLVWWKCHLAGCAFHYGCVQRQQSLLGGNGDEQKLAQHIYSGVARIRWGILTDTAQQETSRCLFYLHPKDFEARNSTLKSLCSSRGLGFFWGGVSQVEVSCSYAWRLLRSPKWISNTPCTEFKYGQVSHVGVVENLQLLEKKKNSFRRGA